MKKPHLSFDQKNSKNWKILYFDLLLDTWTDLHETMGVYTVRPELWHGVLFHFRSGPQNRKLAILPWNRLYFGIKFYRESSKSDFESIGLPSNIGETGNTGRSTHFRSFLSFWSWQFSWVLHTGDTGQNTNCSKNVAHKGLHIGCIRCIIWLQILQLIHWSKNFWISPTQIFQIVFFFQNSWTESKLVNSR